MSRETLIEEAANAHRPAGDELHVSAAWYDLSEDDRSQVFDLQVGLRELEAALDEDGFSTTVRAVLARIEGASES